jgi:hypothetical protein
MYVGIRQSGPALCDAAAAAWRARARARVALGIFGAGGADAIVVGGSSGLGSEGSGLDAEGDATTTRAGGSYAAGSVVVDALWCARARRPCVTENAAIIARTPAMGIQARLRMVLSPAGEGAGRTPGAVNAASVSVSNAR